jgi:hypothetical protein
MSNPSLEKINKEHPPQGKSLTVGFELETKIRLIIQEVLAATIRKYFTHEIDSPTLEIRYKNFKNISLPSNSGSKLQNEKELNNRRKCRR